MFTLLAMRLLRVSFFPADDSSQSEHGISQHNFPRFLGDKRKFARFLAATAGFLYLLGGFQTTRHQSACLRGCMLRPCLRYSRYICMINNTNNFFLFYTALSREKWYRLYCFEQTLHARNRTRETASTWKCVANDIMIGQI